MVNTNLPWFGYTSVILYFVEYNIVARYIKWPLCCLKLNTRSFYLTKCLNMCIALLCKLFLLTRAFINLDNLEPQLVKINEVLLYLKLYFLRIWLTRNFKLFKNILLLKLWNYIFSVGIHRKSETLFIFTII